MVSSSTNIIIMGTAQDGGYPQTGCQQSCCTQALRNFELKRLISCLAIVTSNSCWFIDITPDFSSQFQLILPHLNERKFLTGAFLTHAHIGHYLGLADLGLEVMNTNNFPVYVMPKMKIFLENNAPFIQLIEKGNINPILMDENTSIKLEQDLTIIPFHVPHRNEFSETIGFKIKGKEKSFVYISDIDSWEKWEIDINQIIKENNYLLLDGTFYNSNELKGRSFQDIPHPLIVDSLDRFSLLEVIHKKKVYFTHLNHTNPLIRKDSYERCELEKKGYNVAEDGMIFNI